MTIEQSLMMRALRLQPVSRTPVWIMRQAGRYLPEYRQIREQAGNFMALCRNPELACAVTMQPLQRYQLDAAILFSDILTIPDAMGLGLNFIEGEGPIFQRRITSLAAIKQLPTVAVMDNLTYVMSAVQLIRKTMPDNLPLIGFSGSPWTLACYMIEGQSSRDFKHALLFLYNQPQALHELLNKLTIVIMQYVEAQIFSGVNIIMLFDTWGGILTKANYLNFSLHYMTQIVQYIKQRHPNIPIILFTKGGNASFTEMVASNCDAIGLDWTVDLGAVRTQVTGNVALQGNLDPSVLRAEASVIENQVLQVLKSFGSGTGHIFNLGHGITPDIDPEKVTVMIEAVRRFSGSATTEDIKIIA